MRALLIVLLLILTPWRAWAADTMAVQMAAQGLGSPEAAQAASPSAHCLEMAAQSDTNSQPEDPASPTSQPCGNCAACQVCATVALLPPPVVAALPVRAHALPWAHTAQFANADLAPGQKPPIF